MRHPGKGHRVRRRGDEVGLFAAAANVPHSFQPSLMERSTTDQGLVSGVIMSLTFLIAALAQDTIDSVTDSVVNARIDSGKLQPSEADRRRIYYSAVASLVAIGIGTAGRLVLSQKSDEKVARSVARTAHHWLALTGFAGLTVTAIEAVADVFDAHSGRIRAKPRVDDRSLWPFVIPIGALISMVSELITNRPPEKHARRSKRVRPLRALAIGSGVAFVLSAIALAEKVFASRIDNMLKTYVPGIRNIRLPVGHMVGFGMIGYSLHKAAQYVMHQAESKGTHLEKAYAICPPTKFVSGSRHSCVSWQSLSVQGRRFIGSVLERDNINRVMNTRYAMDPIRIFVGLASAPTKKKRVSLAIRELRRTGAFDRRILVVAQPTGSGYVNYTMVESVEYLSRGDCAIVSMQYSLRPSPLSLDRVKTGTSQHSLLIHAIKHELDKRPAHTRPVVVLFGESLGAWTSQDTFIHQGTDGLDALGIDNALWIGTPADSTWHRQVLTSKPKLNTNPRSVRQFRSYDEVTSMTLGEQYNVRFVLLTNDNDPIAKFGLRLLVQEPAWLTERTNRPDTIPATMRWRTPTTFLHILVDMKNSLRPIPGKFVAVGHDYHDQLPAFVNFVYGFHEDAQTLAAVRSALIANEVARSERLVI